MIQTYDIIGLQETKTDITDNIHVPGYITHIFHRNKNNLSRYKSGGIALLIKENLNEFIRVDNQRTCSLILLFTISGKLYGLSGEDDLKCGIVYVPPIGSKFSVEDPLFEIQSELLRYCGENKHVLLFGDFNSRCGNLVDYTCNEEFITDLFHLDEISETNARISELFENNKIPIERKVVDKNINNYGREFINMCKNNDLFILNGRINPDYYEPKLTCRNASVVDYFLSTAELFESIVSLQTNEFCELYSDVHCPIEITLRTKQIQNEMVANTRENQSPTIKLWEQCKAENFVENLDVLKIADIEVQIDNLSSSNDISQSNLDHVVTHIEQVFENCALSTFGTVKHKCQTAKVSTKPAWFNSDCQSTRNKYNKIRKAYNKYKTNTYKVMLKAISKEYKCTLRKSRVNYNQTRITKLRNLRTSNPKEYWKILNSERKTKETNASLQSFYDHFKHLNDPENIDVYSTSDQNESDQLNEDEILQPSRNNNAEINEPFTESEIRKAIKNLKNNKSPGIDKIKNEHIKASVDLMIPVYIKLFNLVFDHGIVPESWTTGLIKPIYKNKGDATLPENYRPITLLSCLGKVFTAVLNNRLNIYAERNHIIHDTQAGFRKNYSTIDNIFILNSLIDLMKKDKKKLFCCFIDFKQAFDSVWHAGLWKKLEDQNINGKCLTVIKSMYNGIKSKVIGTTGETSEPFNCTIGVRQGENLSPILFSLFLNDLENFLQSKIDGINVKEDITVLLKLFILLYADDTVIFSDNKADLQNALTYFKEYCDRWKLNINVTKTKIMIIGKGRITRNLTFSIGDKDVEIVDGYKYLGVFLSQTGSFIKAKKHIAEQANKAMFSILRKAKTLSLPYDIQIELFEKTVKPILLYACEIWGPGNVDILERTQLKFFKYIFKLKKSTPSYMIYGELGLTPLIVDIQTRIISFWTRIIDDIDSNPTSIKLSSKMYQLLYTMHERNRLDIPWISYVKNVLCNAGFPGIWQTQSYLNSIWLKKAIHLKLRDMYIQKWYEELSRSSDTNMYKYVKTSFGRSKYINLLPTPNCKSMFSFMTRNHRFPVEVGRWQNITHNERKCTSCNMLGDEYHYLMECKDFTNLRKKFLPIYYRSHPNFVKFTALLNTDEYTKLLNLSNMIYQLVKYTN